MRGGLPAQLWGWSAGPAMIAGIAGGLIAAVLGLLALRTAGVQLHDRHADVCQAGYLTLLYFAPVTAETMGSPSLQPAGRSLL